MTDLKDVKPHPEQSTAIPSLYNLSRISEILTAQTSGLQNAIQSVADQQNRLFANATFVSSLDKFAQSVQKAFAPTQELVNSFLKATRSLRIDIAPSQSIGSDITLSLKAINSISEIHKEATKSISEVEEIQSGSSCLVSMSAKVKEQYNNDGIVYENSADVQMVAKVSDISENQKLILEKLTKFEEMTAIGRPIPAKLIDIGFVNNSHSTLRINGKIIQFRSEISSVVLYTFFGRKNSSRTKAHEVEYFYNKCHRIKDWFALGDEGRRKFKNSVYQSVRNINNRFMEATKRGEKLIIQDGKNAYILNPKLFK